MSGNVFALHGGAAPDPLLGDQAQQALLGSLLTNMAQADNLPSQLRPEHFSHPDFADVFRVLTAARAAGRTGQGLLTAAEGLRGAVPQAKIADLMGSFVSNQPGYVKALGDQILDLFRRRELRGMAAELTAAVQRGTLDNSTDTLVRDTQARLEEIGGGSVDHPPVLLDDAMGKAVTAFEQTARGEVHGISTGMASVDEALGFLEPGTMVVLAARPGMGKTALAVQWAVGAARAGGAVLFISLEMQATEIGRRVLSAASGLPVTDIKRARDPQKTADRLVAAQKEMRGYQFAIEDASGQTPSMMSVRARAWQRRWGQLDLIVVDHMHIAKPEAGAERHGGTYAVGQISNALKRLAKDLGCPVLALAQLNRAVEARDEKRPTNADLRQSGDIEQDADQILFVHRPEYYLAKAPPEAKPGETGEQISKRRAEWHDAKRALAGKAELIIAKNRDGADGMVALEFHGPTTSFSEVPAHGEETWR